MTREWRERERERQRERDRERERETEREAEKEREWETCHSGHWSWVGFHADAITKEKIARGRVVAAACLKRSHSNFGQTQKIF